MGVAAQDGQDLFLDARLEKDFPEIIDVIGDEVIQPAAPMRLTCWWQTSTEGRSDFNAWRRNSRVSGRKQAFEFRAPIHEDELHILVHKGQVV